MTDPLPLLYIGRHGETAWTLSGQHTGRTDLPLTENGEHQARALGERLRGLSIAKVLTSPSQRAVRTAELAGFGAVAEVVPDLAEWDYGAYEGRRTAEILTERPDWQLFRDGAPGGELPDQIGARADRVVVRYPRGSRECAGGLQRAHLARAGRVLAGIGCFGRPLFGARHGEPQHSRLRAQPRRAGHPAMERHQPFESLTATRPVERSVTPFLVALAKRGSGQPLSSRSWIPAFQGCQEIDDGLD